MYECISGPDFGRLMISDHLGHFWSAQSWLAYGSQAVWNDAVMRCAANAKPGLEEWKHCDAWSYFSHTEALVKILRTGHCCWKNDTITPKNRRRNCSPARLEGDTILLNPVNLSNAMLSTPVTWRVAGSQKTGFGEAECRAALT